MTTRGPQTKIIERQIITTFIYARKKGVNNQVMRFPAILRALIYGKMNISCIIIHSLGKFGRFLKKE